MSLLVVPVASEASAETVVLTRATPATTTECLTGTPEPNGAPQRAFAHDGATVSNTVKARVERDLAEFAGPAATARRAAALPAEIVVPVQVHIIRGTHQKDRRVTRAQARRLFSVLQGGFAGQQDRSMVPTGIRFQLNKITVSRNDRWFHARPGSRADTSMKRALHRGKRRVLNIYLNNLNDGSGSLLGVARFPWLAAKYPKRDGITINVAALPGGKAGGYNLGDTVIHEAGHWFGLLHTFEGACDGPGDYVNDTPAEAEPSFECEVSRDSCPTDRPAGWVTGDPEPPAALDPVRNFMDYSYDRCMKHFTADQRTRAVTLFMRYRYGR